MMFTKKTLWVCPSCDSEYDTVEEMVKCCGTLEPMIVWECECGQRWWSENTALRCRHGADSGNPSEEPELERRIQEKLRELIGSIEYRT